MIESLTFITGNPDKLKDTSRYLKASVNSKKIDLTEIQSLNLSDIVTHKVTEAQRLIGGIVLIEDVALTFSALKALPGPFIKWFYETLGNDGLCKLLNNPFDRSAVATVMYGLHDGKNIELFEGSIKGTIALEPRGNWFAWSSIFIPDGYDQTWSEMSEELRDKTSMRSIALSKLNTYLESST